jgi:glycosyltransferase involved in cell wall biosynthesis
VRATVVIPTFDHGRLLWYFVRSALAQTVGDIEVFVIGDGVPDATREIVAVHLADPAALVLDRRQPLDNRPHDSILTAPHEDNVRRT